ncbi:hypothetical protein DL93DRAFT_2088335 [Clavulina sp. PMI_390]|nr:hypothetical protein DL93DRAFT_2088335 [Clavulina sp. PMI_390]
MTMPNAIPYLFRLFGRKSIAILIVLSIVTYTLYNDPDDPSSHHIISSSSTHNNIPSPHTDPIVHLPTHPLQPESCDPKTYPLDSLQRRLLTPQAGPDPIWGPENHKQFSALCNCVLANTCAPNQDQVVILNTHYFQPWYSNEVTSNPGETIWATSIIESLRVIKYTFLYVDSREELRDFYRLLSTSVVGIIMHEDRLYKCWADTKHCVKSPANPLGPPIWKMLTFHFWAQPAHPLGRLWTLSPEDYAAHAGADSTKEGNTYIGYSIEPSCDEQPIIPASERTPKAVYAMTKCVSYLAPQPLRAWPPSFYAHAARSLGVHFTIGSINGTTPWAVERCGGDAVRELVFPQLSEFGGEDAMTNLGPLSRPVFMRKVAESQVLLGVGRPWISPTPYQALCLGVPFINPILEWDHSKPEDRKSWDTQHNGLRDLNPPYVYNVYKDDEAGFLSALSQAMERPIGRYIPPGRSLVEVAGRLQTALQRDWRQEAEDLLGERIRTKQGERFTL